MLNWGIAGTGRIARKFAETVYRMEDTVNVYGVASRNYGKAYKFAKGSHVRKKIEAKRLSLDELCIYKEVPRQWMNQLLEAARLAPSTMNSQPWRFVVYDNRIHIFSKKHGVEKFGKWDELNFGIMFANMMVAAEELWLDVDLIRLGEITQKNFSNSQYVLSAILRA